MLLRHAEFGRQFHSFGFRHLGGDLLQEVEALIREGMGLPGQLCVEVVLTLHIGQIEPNLPELADFVWRKACRVGRSNHRDGVRLNRNVVAGGCNRIRLHVHANPHQRMMTGAERAAREVRWPVLIDTSGS